MITTFDQILEKTRKEPMRTVAVAVAEKESVLESVQDAMAAELATPILFGHAEKIREEAAKINFDISGLKVVDQPDDLSAAHAAVAAVHSGEANILMKGHIHTDDFLRAILDRESGLRTGSIMSHVFVLETKSRGKMTFVTDGAMNIAPDLVTKAGIIMNAVYLANAFGIDCPKVGILAAVEVVNPAMPATLDAGALHAMEHRRQFPNCTVSGPFALDNAVDPEAAAVKGISGEVAGNCDILVCPSIEAGNILAKSFSFLGGGHTAGVLVGAAAPVVLTSRADSATAKLYSLATAVLMFNMSRSSRLKIGRVHF